MSSPLELVALAAWLLAGLGLSRWALASLPAGPARTILSTSLGLALGAGLASCAFFLRLYLGGNSGPLPVAAEAALAIGAALGLVRLARRSAGAAAQQAPLEPPARAPLTWIAWATAALVLVLFALAFAFEIAREPYGSMDVISIWNMHARVLHLGGEDWILYFQHAPTMPHRDYPLALPATNARLWNALGEPAPLASQLVAGGFAALFIALLGSLVAILRGGLAAALVLVAWLATPELSRNAGGQMADHVLAGFLLATLGLTVLALRGERPHKPMLVAAGLAAGLVAWTKNEGLVLWPALAVGWLVLLLPRLGPRRALAAIGPFLLGAAPALAALVLFKLQVAPANDIVQAGRWDEIRALVADPARYGTVLSWIAPALAHFGGGLLIAVAILALLGRLRRGEPAPRGESRTAGLVALVLALMLLGDLAAYVITPLDLLWHLRTSFSRLVLQLWPGALLVAALVGFCRGASRAAIEP